MSFAYHNRGDDLILDKDTSEDFAHDPVVRRNVMELASRNVVETGRDCNVFAHDESTLLAEVTPTSVRIFS